MLIAMAKPKRNMLMNRKNVINLNNVCVHASHFSALVDFQMMLVDDVNYAEHSHFLCLQVCGWRILIGAAVRFSLTSLASRASCKKSTLEEVARTSPLDDVTFKNRNGMQGRASYTLFLLHKQLKYSLLFPSKSFYDTVVKMQLPGYLLNNRIPFFCNVWPAGVDF